MRTKSFKTPIGYAIAGSLFLHIFLVSVYGNLLISEEVPIPPPPPKKFQIEMVVKKPKPIKKIKVKEKKIIRPTKVTQIKIKNPHPARSAQKLRKKEIALSPMPQMITAKPKMAQEEIIPTLKKSYQKARADVSPTSMVSRPRKIEKLHTSEITPSKNRRSMKTSAKPADFSPPPRPVESVRIFSQIAGKATGFHKSAVGFAPSIPKLKSVPVANIFPGEGRTIARIHDGRKVIAPGLPQARTISVAKNLGTDQKRAVEFKSGPPSRSLAPALTAIRPSTHEFESVTTPERTAKFYEGKTRTVSTLPLARPSKVTPPSNRMSGSSMKKSFVQKGELIAAATFPSPRLVPNIVDPRILDGYLGTLQKLIASAKQYPESARKSGREGKVTVHFTVLKNGYIKNIHLVSKTNYADLNEEAIAAVKRAAPFSDLPEEIGKPFLDIVLPFRFKLNE